MDEILSFRKMITPTIIKILFWIGIVVTVLGGLVAIFHGGGAAIQGLIMLFVGPLIVRVWCELLILLFRIYDSLEEIRRNTAGKADASGGAGFPAAPGQ